MVLLLFSQLIFQLSSPINNNHFILKIQVVSRAVGLLESDGKVIKLMSKSCPLYLLLCGRYCSFHTSMRKVRFNLEEKIVRTFGEFLCTFLSSNIPLAVVYTQQHKSDVTLLVEFHQLTTFQIKNSLLQGKRPFFATIFPKQQLTATNLFQANQNSMKLPKKFNDLIVFIESIG